MENDDSQSHQSSVLHGNDAFVNKLLSRSSTSSRQSLRRDRDIYFCKEAGVVPFIWEVQPGIPKDPPNEAFVVTLPNQKTSLTSLDESSLELKDPSSNPNQGQINRKRPSSPLVSSSELKDPSSNPNRSQFNQKRLSSTSCFLSKSKKTRNESPKFSHSESSNSDDHDFFSSSCASKSSPSTSARASPSSKALATSLPMSSKLRSLAKWLLRRLF